MTAYDAPDRQVLADDIAFAMDWWRGAGVDSDFEDDPQTWLLEANEEASDETAVERPGSVADTAQQNPRPIERAQSAPDRTDFFAQNKPASLAEFREFWLTAPGLDAIGPRGRVAPRGPANAALMILVLDPEEDDTHALLSGPQGRLLDRFLSAAEIDAENVYFASALPRSTPMADAAALAASGLDSVTAHHLALANPERLIAFGAGLNPFLGQNEAGNGANSPSLNARGALPPLLMSDGLDSLLNMPRLKARFWRRWIEWSALH